MKDPGDRTKVVLRHLPPTLSQVALKDQIDARFAGRYNWFSFRAGRGSHLNQPYSRAYIDFKRAEDVIDFARAFDGHLFLNEKGTHFKTIVEYAPSQRVPKSWTKKDGREGAIFKDSEYVEFLEFIGKPVENLPSAEVQLERREAERAAGGTRDSFIVTPLMDFVRQKRAAKSGSQRSATSIGKLGRRAGGASVASSSAVAHRRGPERRRTPTATYVMRDNTRIASNKDKSTYVQSPRREDQQQLESDLSIQVVSSLEALEDVAGTSGKNTVSAIEGTIIGTEGPGEAGKKKMLLLKSKDKESTNGRITEASFSNSIGVAVQPQRRQMSSIKGVSSVQHHGGSMNQQGITSPVRGSPSSSFKLHQRREQGGRIVKGILLKDFQQPQSPPTFQAEQQNQVAYVQKDEKLATIDLHGVANIAEKQDRRMRNKDRPDRPVWTPRRRSDGAMGADESQPCIASDCAQSSSDVVAPIRSQVHLEGVSQFHHGPTLGLMDFSIEDNLSVDNSSANPSGALGKSHLVDSAGAQIVWLNRMNSNTSLGPSLEQSSIQGELKSEMLMTSRTGENGTQRQIMRRPLQLGIKESDSSLGAAETKSSKRGGASGYGNHEKQVWVAVQKSGSGS